MIKILKGIGLGSVAAYIFILLAEQSKAGFFEGKIIFGSLAILGLLIYIIEFIFKDSEKPSDLVR